ncbi:alpha-tectorin-like [Engystomops pustulosus]|uniref:alpha-tectorin-like n=1 Tax=Engystomops pustulosus TaxID=76066 RepID=UPI003AFB410C
MASSQKLMKHLIAVCFVFLAEQSLAAASDQCPPNSVYGCKPLCYNTCDNLNATACYQPCTEACHCIQGYVYKSEGSSECVPVSSCNVPCAEHMTFNECLRVPH